MPAPSIHAFAEKVAVITDAADPVGRAVALQLALQGSYVIVGLPSTGGRDAASLEELKSIGTLSVVVEADMSRPEGVEALVAAAGSAFGRIDLLVGVFPESTSVVRSVTHAARELMAQRPKPKVVNVARFVKADAPRNPMLEMAVLTETLASELPSNFRVNMVSVGEGFGGAQTDLDPELFPARGGVEADDAARVVVFLLSSEATAINGRNIIVGR